MTNPPDPEKETLKQRLAEMEEELERWRRKVDNSELLLTERALRRSRQLLDATQRLTHVGGWEWDINAQTKTWTGETYRLHGLPVDEANSDSGKIEISLSCYDPPDRAKIFEAFRRCCEHGENYDLTFPFTSLDGRRLWIRTMGEAVWDKGRIVQVRGNIVDITRFKNNEELLQARLALSEVAATTTLRELLRMTLDEAERLTNSRAGFFHFYDESSQTISLMAWSSKTSRDCAMSERLSTYHLSQAGCWAESIRGRCAVIHNDYAGLPQRHPLPPGHVALARELVVPVLRNGQVVAVLGVGNKERDYQDEDLATVSTLANLAWDIVLRKRAEEALRHSLQEKEVLLREVHHRVKNNMAAIIGLFDMQRQTISDVSARATLDELGFRVRAMSLVHEKLYRSESLSRIDFQEYCESLLSHLHLSLGSPRIHYRIEARDAAIPLDLAVPCGMIINELATNALKYAFPAERCQPGLPPCLIRVVLRQTADTLVLTVADNGIGLPMDFAWSNATSLGLTLVRMLGMHQLGGTYEVERLGGTSFTLTFSPRENSKQ
jgi:two-component sensor histidine kinase